MTYRDFIMNNEQIEFILFIRKNFQRQIKKITCELVANIVKPLYKLLGYKEYDDDLWILKINR